MNTISKLELIERIKANALSVSAKVKKEMYDNERVYQECLEAVNQGYTALTVEEAFLVEELVKLKDNIFKEDDEYINYILNLINRACVELKDYVYLYEEYNLNQMYQEGFNNYKNNTSEQVYYKDVLKESESIHNKINDYYKYNNIKGLINYLLDYIKQSEEHIKLKNNIENSTIKIKTIHIFYLILSYLDHLNDRERCSFSKTYMKNMQRLRNTILEHISLWAEEV